jgi:hypothetical protein
MQNRRYLRSVVLFACALFSGSLLSAQCGMPVFTGQMYVYENFSSTVMAGVSGERASYSLEYIQYLNVTMPNWCQQHHGTWSNGNCTPGPNWICDVNAGSAKAGNAAGARVAPRPAPRISTSQMMQQEILNSATQQILVPVLTNLFSNIFNFDSTGNDAQNAQLQQQYLQQQQQLAAQRRAAEEQRKQQMLEDLSGTMKLNGGSDLHLKTSGDEADGLHLKLIGGINDPDHAGIPSLPGIALNGGNTPYGIPGLPGIYTNGPTSAPVMQASGMQLKLGDSSAGSNTTPPAPPATDSTAQAGGLQLKLGDSGSSVPAAPAAQSLDDSRQTQAQQAGTSLVPAPTTTTADAANAVPASAANGGSNPALAQAQTIQAASQAAAGASNLETAKALAGVGWDSGSAKSTAAPAVPVPSMNARVMVPEQTAKITLPANPGSAAEAGMAPGEPIASLAPPPAHYIPAEHTPASPRVQQMSNQQLQAATCHVHDLLVKMTKDSLQDARNLEEWANDSTEAQADGLDKSAECLVNLTKDSVGDWLLKKLKLENESPTGEHIDDKEWKEFVQDVVKADLEFSFSHRTKADLLDNARAILQSFYEHGGEIKLLRFSKQGAQITDFIQCATDYTTAAMQWDLDREAIFRATGNDWGPTILGHHFTFSQGTDKGSIEENMKAEKAISAFYNELVGESLRRGLDSNACH